MKKTNKLVLAGIFIMVVFFGKKLFNKYHLPKMTFGNAKFIDIATKKTIKIDDFKGQVIFVSFFQTWCGDCAKETPILNKLAQNINSPKLKIIYITDEPYSKIISFKNRFDSNHITFMQSTKPLIDLGIHVYPTTFLIDENGNVLKTKLEGYNWLNEETLIRKLISQL